MAKNPAEFFVSVKLHGMAVPDASSAVNTPTTLPEGAALLIEELLMLIVIEYPIGNGAVLKGLLTLRSVRSGISLQLSQHNVIVTYLFCQYIVCVYLTTSKDLDAVPDAMRTRL